LTAQLLRRSAIMLQVIISDAEPDARQASTVYMTAESLQVG
jgi:hypothetical protein